MDILDIILIIAIFAVYFIAKIKYESKEDPTKENKKYPYKKKFLLTKAEYAFYQVLKPICDKKEILICPKVRMEDFLEITDKKNLQKYRGYIKSRHIDFILCNSKLYMIAGIELDDKTHQKDEVKEKDNFKDKVFQTINIPLYRIKMSEGEYKKQIEKILEEICTQEKDN